MGAGFVKDGIGNIAKVAPGMGGGSPVQKDTVDVDSLHIPEWLKDGLRRLDLDGDGERGSNSISILG
jgi:hypothetical protein